VLLFTVAGMPFRVGNLMGAMRPRQAQVSSRICILLAASCMAACGILILALRQQLGSLFSHDPEVIRAVVANAPYLAALQVSASVAHSPCLWIE
jgi:multidrug resistance protein, MATE family